MGTVCRPQALETSQVASSSWIGWSVNHLWVLLPKRSYFWLNCSMRSVRSAGEPARAGHARGRHRGRGIGPLRGQASKRNIGTDVSHRVLGREHIAREVVTIILS